jgi:hypothetical protein
MFSRTRHVVVVVPECGRPQGVAQAWVPSMLLAWIKCRHMLAPCHRVQHCSPIWVGTIANFGTHATTGAVTGLRAGYPMAIGLSAGDGMRQESTSFGCNCFGAGP